MAARYGLHGKLFYDASGVADDTWIEITKVIGQPVITEGATENDVTRRAGGGWEESEPGAFALSIDFVIPWEPGDTVFDALHAAFLNDTTIGIAAFDGDYAAATATVKGPEFDAVVTKFQPGQVIDNIQMTDITVEPTLSDTPPYYWTTLLRALPNGIANVDSGTIDCGPGTPVGTLEIEAPVLTTGELPDAETMTYDIITDTTADFATPTTLVDDAITQTGAAGAGAALANYSAAMPAGAERYLKLNVANSGAGNASAKNARFSLLM